MPLSLRRLSLEKMSFYKVVVSLLSLMVLDYSWCRFPEILNSSESE